MSDFLKDNTWKVNRVFGIIPLFQVVFTKEPDIGNRNFDGFGILVERNG